MIEPPRPFGPHPMVPHTSPFGPRFAVAAATMNIVQRKCGLDIPRAQLLEGDVALVCDCGNRDSAPSTWFTSRVTPRILCSAECGRIMRLDSPKED